MKKIIVTGALTAAFAAALLTGCGSKKLTADEVEAKIAEANTNESIWADYGSVVSTTWNSDGGDGVTSTTYQSANTYYYEYGDEAFSYMDSISGMSTDPDFGPSYSCIIDMDSYENILNSYLTLHYFNTDGYTAELKDDNVIELKNDSEILDYTYDPKTFLITEYTYSFAETGEKLTDTTYVYNKDEENEKYMSLADEKWDAVVNTSNYVNLTVNTYDGEQCTFTVPEGAAVNVYTSGCGYFHNDTTEEDYYFEPLTEDTVLTEYEQ